MLRVSFFNCRLSVLGSFVGCGASEWRIFLGAGRRAVAGSALGLIGPEVLVV